MFSHVYQQNLRVKRGTKENIKKRVVSSGGLRDGIREGNIGVPSQLQEKHQH